ncbi:MAG: hypothetical protein ACRDHK_16070 [Actinomycetota bacterium]
MENKDVQAWLDGYIGAWKTNDPEDIGRLFTDDARYHTVIRLSPDGRCSEFTEWLMEHEKT